VTDRPPYVVSAEITGADAPGRSARRTNRCVRRRDCSGSDGGAVHQENILEIPCCHCSTNGISVDAIEVDGFCQLSRQRGDVDVAPILVVVGFP